MGIEEELFCIIYSLLYLILNSIKVKTVELHTDKKCLIIIGRNDSF